MPNDNNAPIGVDAEGYEVLTKAVSELLNSYPGLDELGGAFDTDFGELVTFEDIRANGLAFSASNGALIMRERRSITDYVRQECRFPFFIVFRAATKDTGLRIRIQTFLDKLGKWLCHEPTEYERAEYPELASGRKITRVTRDNSYGVEPAPDGSQDWLLPVTITYSNEFQL